ncbi:glycosyltransferase 87 family protein [Streptomyces hazeniae]
MASTRLGDGSVTARGLPAGNTTRVPDPRRSPPQRPPVPWQALLGGAVLTLSLAAFAAYALVTPFPMADVQVYRAEGAAALRGHGLYDFTVTEWELPATYPPFAALLFVPLELLPATGAKLAFLAGNLALLALLVHLSARLAGRTVTPPALAALTGAALWLEPVFQTMAFGQVNLALACLVLWDLGRPDGARGKGLAVGLAAGIKLTPAIFAVYLLLTGRARAACAAFGGFCGTVLAGAFFLPGDSVVFWTDRLFETGRVGTAWIVDNQSVQGAVARVLHVADPGPLWMLPAAAVAGTGLWLARRLCLRGGPPGGVGDPARGGTRAVPCGVTCGDVWGLLSVAFTALLVSPISWTHHWVWCVPLLALLWERRVLCAAVAAVFAARTMWLVPRDGDLDLRGPWWVQPFTSPYVCLGLALLTLLAVLARRRGVTSR